MPKNGNIERKIKIQGEGIQREKRKETDKK